MDRRARVAFFINSLEQGGAEGQLYALIDGLDRTRFDCSLVVCTRKGASPDKLGLAAYQSLDSPLFPLPGAIQKLTEVLRDWRPDIVHAYKSWENTAGRFAARKAGVRAVVGSVRRPRLPALERWAEMHTWRMADVILVNSRGIRDELVHEARVPSDSVEVIENGVDLDRFRPLPDAERNAERRARGMDGTFTMITPARISGEKNHVAIVRAIGRLARERLLPAGFRLVLAGRDSLPMYGSAVRLAIKIEGVGSMVSLPGSLGGLERWVGASDGILLPSRFEGLPNAVVEALACGVPAVVSRAANADQVVTDGLHGIVAEHHDATGIANALRRFFALEPAARRAMGERGRALAVQRFGMTRMVAETAAVYERLVSPRAQSGA